jgi:fructosamine-3-kinase
VTTAISSEVERLLQLGPAAARLALVDEPDGLRLTRAQLGSAATSLVLAGESADEWVLHWPQGGEPAAWRWPEDPGLPVLHPPATVTALLADPSWSQAVPDGAVGAIDRVGYKPNRRATFRVELGSHRYVLKLVGRRDLSGALRAGRFADALPPRVARAPRMVAHSEALGGVLLAYLRGTPLDRLERSARGEALAAIPRLLAGLHGRPVDELTTAGQLADALPEWDAAKVIRKLDAITTAAARPAPAAAQAAQSVTAAIAASLAARHEPAVVVHGDLSLRNLVWAATAPPGTSQLAVIDWDSAAIGPREADLSPLVGLLGSAAGPLVEAYEQASGHPLDRPLLDALVHANRLTRTLRRAASGRDTPALAATSVATIAASIGHDGLRAG